MATLRKFERTGEIAFVSFIRLAMALGDEAALDGLLAEHQRYGSLRDVLEPRVWTITWGAVRTAISPRQSKGTSTTSNFYTAKIAIIRREKCHLDH